MVYFETMPTLLMPYIATYGSSSITKKLISFFCSSALLVLLVWLLFLAYNSFKLKQYYKLTLMLALIKLNLTLATKLYSITACLQSTLVDIVLLSTLIYIITNANIIKELWAMLDNKFTNSSNLKKDAANFKFGLKYFISGLIIFSLSIFYLETNNQPYYFTNDDNYHQFLPVIIDSCKCFFEEGLFPAINPHQYAGIPTTSTSIYGLTYPITYLSYWVSKYLFNNEFFTIDVFCIFHLAIAYITAYWAAKSCGVKNYLRVIFALCYSLSGYSLIGGRSWYYMTPTIAIAPLIVISINYLIANRVNLKWIFINGLVLGALSLAGNIQMWTYTIIFFILSAGTMVILQKMKAKKLLSLIPPILIGAAIAMPLLYVTSYLFKGFSRNPHLAHDLVFQNFTTLFLPHYPFSFLKGVKYNECIGEMIFSGGIFIATGFLSLGFIIKNHKSKLFLFCVNFPWLIIGLIALWLACGPSLGLWSILHSLPFLNKFQTSYKMLVFVNLFLNLSGAMILSEFTLMHKKKIQYLFCSMMFIVLILHLINARQAFFKYKIKPYSSNFSTIIKAIPDIREHRIYTISPLRSKNQDYSLSMNNNFATIFGLYSVNGYDDRLEVALKENSLLYKKSEAYKNNLDYMHSIDNVLNEFRTNYTPQSSKVFKKEFSILHYNIESIKSKVFSAFGVKYIFYQPPAILTKRDRTQWITSAKKYLDTNFRKILVLENGTTIYENPGAASLAYEYKSLKALPIKFNTQGAVINTSSLTENTQIIVNMTYYPNYAGYLDNGRAITIEKDHFNRMLITLKAKTQYLSIKYKAPWTKGLYLAVLIFALAIFSMLLIKDKTPTRD